MSEPTCQHQVQRFSNNLGYYFVRCNAPIPRLDEGPCTAEVAGVGECLAPRDYWRHGQTVVGRRNHAYLGPLASECANSHPVAVPAEESAP